MVLPNVKKVKAGCPAAGLEAKLTNKPLVVTQPSSGGPHQTLTQEKQGYNKCSLIFYSLGQLEGWKTRFLNASKKCFYIIKRLVFDSMIVMTRIHHNQPPVTRPAHDRGWRLNRSEQQFSHFMDQQTKYGLYSNKGESTDEHRRTAGRPLTADVSHQSAWGTYTAQPYSQ